MSDITTCPKCKADLNVSNARGESFVCSRCGFTATKPLALPTQQRDLDVRDSGWGPIRRILEIAVVGAGLLYIVIRYVSVFTGPR